MENTKKHQSALRRDKHLRFSIRKFNVGVASVAVAAFWMVSGTVAMAETPTVSPATDSSIALVAEQAQDEDAASEDAEEATSDSVTTDASQPVADLTAASEQSSESTSASAVSSEEGSATAENSSESSEKASEASSEAVPAVTSPVVAPATTATTAASPLPAVTYKVTYTDEETGEVVYSENRSAIIPEGETKDTVKVTVKADLTASKALAAYKLTTDQQALVTAVLADRKRIINFTVRKDDTVTGTDGQETEGYSGFRAGEQNIGRPYNPASDSGVPNGSVSLDQYIATQPVGPDGENLSRSKVLDQLAFMDFTQANLKGGQWNNGQFMLGQVFEKEVATGYTIRMTVTELKPFRATEAYREMAQKIDALNNTNYATTVYNPNAVNASRNGGPNSVVGNAAYPWAAHTNFANFNTGNLPNHISSQVDGGDVGIKFKVEAIVNGNSYPVDVVVFDGEDLSNREVIYFTTDANAQPWELFGELNGDRKNWMVASPTSLNDGFTDSQTSPYGGGARAGAGVYPTGQTPNPQAYVNPNDNAGIGTHTLGGYYNFLYSYPGGPTNGAGYWDNNYRLSIPMFASRGASEVGVYINSPGMQAAMVGFRIADLSDAPISQNGQPAGNYGTASHGLISQSVTGTARQIPFLGRNKADIDSTTTDTQPVSDFNTNFIGDDDVEGKELNIRIEDEGEEQLSATATRRYELVDKTASSYTLSIKANANGTQPAHIKAWLDYNNNGQFDANEGTAVATISGATEQTVNLTWSGLNLSTLPADLEALAVRVRIASDQADIANPTGYAATGEVEDFQVILKQPPRGTFEHTEGLQGQKQTGAVSFTAHGLAIDPTKTVREHMDLRVKNAMPDEFSAANIGIVVNGRLVQTYTRPGEGTYTIKADQSNGSLVTVEFQPEAGFTGVAQGVVIRARDKNGMTTNARNNATETPDTSGATEPAAQRNLANISNLIGVKSWDSLYIPEVKPVTPTAEPSQTEGLQGQAQTSPVSLVLGSNAFGTDATVLEFKEGSVDTNGNGTIQQGTETVALNPNTLTLLDATGQKTTSVTVDGQGTYTLSNGIITFQPLPTFRSTATPVRVQVADMNGTTVETTYTPKVTPVDPTGTNTTSTGQQGQTQTGRVPFTAGHLTVPINDTVPATFDDGSTTKVVPNEGTYTVAPDGTVTFTPLPTFKGPATGVTVKRVDINGTSATATYKPTVEAVTPDATPATTEGLQGKTQTTDATKLFTPGNDETPIKNETIKLLNPDGSVATTNTVPATKDGKTVGSYTLDPATGVITFTPNKDFTGTPDKVAVQAADKNGTTVKTDYTPTVIPVTPRGSDATTEGKQGQTQSAQVYFEPGHQDVPIRIDGEQQVRFLNEDDQPIEDDEIDAKDVQGNVIGKFILNELTADVQFVPNGDYTGAIPVQTIKIDGRDINGTPAIATYTPKVTPVNPTAQPLTTTKLQGEYHSTPYQDVFKAGDAATPIDERSVTLLDANGQEVEGPYLVPGVGVYQISDNFVIEFVPEPGYHGTPAPVTIQAKDKNGTVVTTTYTPTITQIQVAKEDVTSRDIQGAVQTGRPTFNITNNDLPGQVDDIEESKREITGYAFDEAGATTKTVDGEGSYSIDPATGLVTFTPLPTYHGTATPVEVVATVTITSPEVSEEAIDTPATVFVKATYTPTVIPVTPVATPSETSGLQGQPQTSTIRFVAEEGADDKKTLNFKPGFGDVNENQAEDLKEVVALVPSTLTLLDKDGQAVKTVTVDQGVYTLNNDGSITFQPNADFVGTATPVEVQVADKNGTTVKTTYTPTVTPVKPTATPKTTTGLQGEDQTTDAKTMFEAGSAQAPIAADSIKLLTADGSVADSNTVPATKDGETVGSYELDPTTGVITFTPNPDFTGTADPVGVQAEDKNGSVVKTDYTPTVVPLQSDSQPKTTFDVQGVTQKGTPTFTIGNVNDDTDGNTTSTREISGYALKDADAEGKVVVPGQGTYSIDSTTGEVTFVPEKQFTGTATGVTVQATVKVTNTDGTSAELPDKIEDTYVPTVTPVKPTAKDTTSTGVQGQTQTGTVIFTPGDSRVPIDETVPATFEDGLTTKDVPNVGTYTVTPDGLVTFKPLPSYTGTPVPVTVKRVDTNGTSATATYTPTVTPVTPTATPATTVGKQGQDQTTDATKLFTEGDKLVPIDNSTITLLDENKQPVTTLPAKDATGKEVGSYTVDATGTITFTPNKDFTGTPVPATVQAKDENGKAVETTYTPTVTPVTPTATPAATSGKQGQPQTTDATKLFKEGDKVVPIDNSTITLLDENKQPVTTLPAKDATGKEVGSYTVDATGTITFTPNDDFTGTAVPAAVQAKDENGTSVETTYTPTVVGVTPTATPAVTSGKQGQTQTTDATKLFTEGDKLVPIDNSTITLLDENKQPVTTLPAKDATGKEVGSYTVDATGTITFTPNKDFTGTPVPAAVQAKDDNGTSVETTYTPTVTPVKPTATPATSTGKQGQEQSGLVTFTEGDKLAPIDKTVPATFEDGSTTKVVPNVGTYTVTPDGLVTFTPLPSYTGTPTPVTVKRVDTNGTEATATYTPTVTPVTPSGRDETSIDKQNVPQTKRVTFRGGDRQVPIDEDVPATFEDGTTEKVVPNEGTYTIAPDGTVTFTPIPTFIGTGTGVTVKRVDINGTSATATYTPTVTPADQIATVTFVSKVGETETELSSYNNSETGLSNAPLTYSPATSIKELENLGYKLVESNYPENGSFDNDPTVAQAYKVVVTPRIETVPPTEPKVPGQPVDPNNPDGPKWPEGVDTDSLNETVNREIKYVFEDGTEIPNQPKVSEDLKFTRTATTNLVTKETTHTDWAPETVDTFEDKANPVVPGYFVSVVVVDGDINDDKTKVPAETVTSDSDDIDAVVVYKPLGKYTFDVPPGVTPPTDVTYPNDPTDPTKPTPPTDSIVPYIPGSTPTVNGEPLKPVDPADPTKGYVNPPLPTDPSKDTPIVYTKDDQVGRVDIVVQTDKTDESTKSATPLETTELAGKSGDPIVYDKDAKLLELYKAGYEVIKNPTIDSTFDNDKNTPQNFEIVVTPRVETVPPTDPKEPNTPVDPDNPDTPRYPEGVKASDLNKSVTRTVTYIKKTATGEEVIETKTETVTFTRTATVNLVTKDVTYTPWTATAGDNVLNGYDLPAVDGYVALEGDIEASQVDRTVNETSTAINEKVVYLPLGKYTFDVPPGVTPPTDVTYPNDPTDPTKPTPPTDSVVPYIPGSTPTVNGEPLKPVDPTDPTKGYVNPPVPENPTQDTPIVYAKDDQAAKTTFVYKDVKGNVKTVVDGTPGKTPIEETGKSGEPLTKAEEIAATIKALENAGYKLITNGYPTDGTFDKDKATLQEFEVIVQEREEPVQPDQPKVPGEPVDPNNPDGPKWPEGVKESDLNKSVTRTVTYVKKTATGEEVIETKTETVTFTRTATVNLVTNAVTYTPWTATDGDNVLNGYTLPKVDGYVALEGDIDASQVDRTVNETSTAINEKVVYLPLGKYTFDVPPGVTPPTDVTYPNDPTDPTKPTPPTDSIVPYIPGSTPTVNGEPLKPVDPTDPTKGYVNPPVPENPTQDTTIVYAKDDQAAKTTFVYKDVKGNVKTVVDGTPGKTPIEETGKSGEPLTKAEEIAATIKALENAGYKLITNGYPTDGTFDKDKATLQEFEVIVQEREEPVQPDQPKVPGEPVDPNNPDGPKWPEGVKESDLNKSVTRTVTYVKKTATGEEVIETKTETVTFTRTATVNLVTNAVTYTPWTSGDNVLNGYTLPKVDGYVALEGDIDASQVDRTVTEGSADISEKVVYLPLGKYTFDVPPGVTPPTDVTYPNDPTDPTKPTPPTDSIVPYIPGSIPTVNGEPLKPVDPTDPTKGYVNPPVPENPTQDTTIVYVKDGQKATVKFVDTTGAQVANPNTETGKSGEAFTYSPSTTIDELKKQGYDLVSNDYPENGSFDSDKDKDQTFTVVVTPRIVPVTPEEPKNPTQPVDPTDPNSPKYPDPKDPATPYDKDSLVKEVNRTVTYVYEDGTTASETKTDKVTFRREARVNLVTGEVTYTPWVAVNEDNSFVQIDSPVIPGYIADLVNVPTIDGLTHDSSNVVERVVYKKLGAFVPSLPNGETPWTPITYPNHPTDPTQPGTPVTPIPYVPGFHPVNPKDNTPLVPVDPTDPSKGYIPPVPEVPGEDTPIPYVPVPPTTPEQPEEPVTPTPEQPVQPVTPRPVTPATPATPAKATLPNTGDASSAIGLVGSGLMLVAASMLIRRRRKED